jgi:hypothetical protein
MSVEALPPQARLNSVFVVARRVAGIHISPLAIRSPEA